jgi:hypothetical protein
MTQGIFSYPCPHAFFVYRGQGLCDQTTPDCPVTFFSPASYDQSYVEYLLTILRQCVDKHAYAHANSDIALVPIRTGSDQGVIYLDKNRAPVASQSVAIHIAKWYDAKLHTVAFYHHVTQ